MNFLLTQNFDCSYLPGKQERLAVLAPDTPGLQHSYELLIEAGFRRGGENLYRPLCENCNACQSIRLPVAQFKPSRSQKRILKRNQDIQLKVSESVQDNYYPLYERYIRQKHADGAMFPPSEEQFQGMTAPSWGRSLYLELWLEEQLVAVAITDPLADALSAIYTFYDPDFQQRSLGILAILRQIEYCQQNDIQWLYLGYQVDECTKMNYKTQFLPYQRRIGNQWYEFTKK